MMVLSMLGNGLVILANCRWRQYNDDDDDGNDDHGSDNRDDGDKDDDDKVYLKMPKFDQLDGLDDAMILIFTTNLDS